MTNWSGRDGDGPVQQSGQVVRRRRDGRYHVLEVATPEIARRAKPGQFIEVAVGGPGTLLRRPFSISRISRTGMGGGAVEFVFDAHGPGTDWLASIREMDTIDLIGPLGTSFPLPQQRMTALLIGGGYGVAPLFFLADELSQAGCRIDMIVGAADEARIHNRIEAKRISASVEFTTDDGSFGKKGRVTDVLDDMIRTSRPGAIYACGPNPMLRAVSEAAAAQSIPCLVAVEELMGCGVGVCWTCVFPMRGKDGVVRNKRTCIDGPVFNGARVAWGDSRWGDAARVDDDATDAAADDAETATEAQV